MLAFKFLEVLVSLAAVASFAIGPALGDAHAQATHREYDDVHMLDARGYYNSLLGQILSRRGVDYGEIAAELEARGFITEIRTKIRDKKKAFKEKKVQWSEKRREKKEQKMATKLEKTGRWEVQRKNQVGPVVEQGKNVGEVKNLDKTRDMEEGQNLQKEASRTSTSTEQENCQLMETFGVRKSNSELSDNQKEEIQCANCGCKGMRVDLLLIGKRMLCSLCAVNEIDFRLPAPPATPVEPKKR